jgi:hypothetical protein
LPLKSLGHRRQSSHNLDDQLPSALEFPIIQQFEPATNIENSRALRRGPSRDSIEPGLVLWAELARPFCDIQRDGESGPVELICDVSVAFWEVLDQQVGYYHEIKGLLVNRETFVIE